MYNETPMPGTHYVMVTLHLVRTSRGSADPSVRLTCSYIARDGTSYREAGAILPQGLEDAGDISTGSNANGNVAFLVPQSQIGAGVLSVEIRNNQNVVTVTGFYSLS
jgi:hypothetical protein